MSLINKKIYRLRLKTLYLKNKVLSLTTKKDKQIYIVSSRKYKNRVKEDLVLQNCFLKNNIFSKIVAWEDNEPSDNYLIRTVWGYHNHIDDFINYISDKNTINKKELIIDNADKKKQYELLNKYNICTIDTKFIDNVSELESVDKKLVIKSTVSASGNNTYIIENKDELDKCRGLNNLMVQPYIEGIKDGEISIIVIDKDIKYGIRRYPGIFTEYKKEKYISLDDIPEDIVDIVDKINDIPEYNDVTIMRADFVYDENKYKIMEVELVDPALFIETIDNDEYKKQIYQDIVDASMKTIK